VPRYKRKKLMLRLVTLLLIVSGCVIAKADACPPSPPINLQSDEALDFQVFFDDRPAAATAVQLYAGDKLARSALTDRNGEVRFGLLPRGKYRVEIPGKGTLDVVVHPVKSGLNGPLITWYLFPKSKYHWVAGKRVAGKPCPTWGVKED